jgi:hypothetical protein
MVWIMASQPEDKPHQVSSEEFRKDPSVVFELASSGRTVVVTGEDQQPTMVITTPRNKLPMRFD